VTTFERQRTQNLYKLSPHLFLWGQELQIEGLFLGILVLQLLP